MKKIYLLLLAISFISCDNTIFGDSDWKYEVTGTAAIVNVTISNKDEGISQYNGVSVPWSTTFTKDNMYTYNAFISAQNQGASGSVTVKIYRNGGLVKSATSDGANCIAIATYKYE